MLNSIRKFSSSILAKIFLFIIAIPFIFWGMGDAFRIGGKDTIATIGNDKIYVQDFTRFVNNLKLSKEITEVDLLDRLLSNFIGIKLISLESENFNINISDKSLSKIIKNEEAFKDKNEFSRIKYEKFLVTNSLSSIAFERDILEKEKRKQLFDFIGGGIKSPKFFVNNEYDLLNQKRSISVINLADIYKKKFNFSESDIVTYHKDNIEKFTKIYKSITYAKITPKELAGEEEFTSLFFQKLDEIEDAITSNVSFNEISEKYKLKVVNSDFFSKDGKNIKNEKAVNFSKEVISDIFAFDILESVNLINKEDDYFLIGPIENKKIANEVTSDKTRKLILQHLKNVFAQNQSYELLKKIKKGEFKKNDFQKMANTNEVKIEKIKLNNSADDKIINKALVKQVYTLPENKVGIFYDDIKGLYYLIQIDKVKNASIEANSENYKKYLIKSNARIIQDIYTSYDVYLNDKYKVEINYNTLDNVKNSF